MASLPDPALTKVTLVPAAPVVTVPNLLLLPLCQLFELYLFHVLGRLYFSIADNPLSILSCTSSPRGIVKLNIPSLPVPEFVTATLVPAFPGCDCSHC